MERILAIARNTYRESVRSKVLYSLFFFAFLVMVLSFFFGTVTIGDRVLVVKNFGLFAMSAFTAAYAAIAGSSFLQKELARKTIYNILAKPVKRSEFLLGKYLGMLMTTLVMLFCMGPLLIGFIAMLEGKTEILLLQAFFGIFCQLIIICAVTIFFSAIVVTPVLSGAFTLGVFFAGRSTNYLLYFIDQGEVSVISAKILKLIYIAIPHLDWLDISDEVAYGVSIPLAELTWGLLYSLGYAGFVLVLASLIFRRREFN